MYSDNTEDNESPMDGTGEEMLPDKGSPFEEDNEGGESGADMAVEYHWNEEPRDLSPEEMAVLLDVPVSALKEAPSDNAMGAVQPVGSEGDLPNSPAFPKAGVNLPLSESTLGMPAFSEDAFDDSSGIGGISNAKATEGSADLKSTADMLNLFVTKGRLRALWQRIDRVQKDVRENVPSLALAKKMADQVERARNELLSGPQNYEEAERSINGVELQVTAVQRAQAENKYAVRLLVYELGWGVAMVFMYLYGASYFQTIAMSTMSENSLQAFPSIGVDTLIMVKSAVAGAVGGIVGGLYALWKHVSREMDFSKQFWMWYVTSPVMGLFLGVFVFLVMRVGMITLTIGSTVPEVTSPLAIYALAFIVGFQQNVAYDLMRRVLQVFRFSDTENNG